MSELERLLEGQQGEFEVRKLVCDWIGSLRGDVPPDNIVASETNPADRPPPAE